MAAPGLLVWLIFSAAPALAQAQACRIDLDIARLEGGDLVWPRKAAALIPYGNGNDDLERRAWEREKAAWLKSLDGAALDDSAARDKLRIAQMSHREFLAQYAEGTGLAGRGGFGRLVGHVAIVDRAPGGPVFIIEALLDKGVVRTPLAEWAAGVCNDIFWHGRVKGASPEQRRNIAAEARRHVGAVYSILNRRLDDTRSFYCSKLAWLAITRAVGVSPDRDANPVRLGWYSPRQLIESDLIERLKDPGDFHKPVSAPAEKK